jgi:hypothetical protein
METFKGATSPTSIWKYSGCSITNQYMETLRGEIYDQYMKKLRGATSPTSKTTYQLDNNNENGKWPLCRSMDILSY